MLVCIALLPSRFGNDVVVSDFIVAADILIRILAEAIRSSGSMAVARVREFASGKQVLTGAGWVEMGYDQHISRPVRIGRLARDRMFDIVTANMRPTHAQVRESALGVERVCERDRSVRLCVCACVKAGLKRGL